MPHIPHIINTISKISNSKNGLPTKINEQATKPIIGDRVRKRRGGPDGIVINTTGVPYTLTLNIQWDDINDIEKGVDWYKIEIITKTPILGKKYQKRKSIKRKSQKK